MDKKLSIAVPCYNEEEAIPYFYEEVKKVFIILEEKYNLEIELLFIDDGSRDGTLRILRKLAQNDKRVKYISFSKNFGKESGIYAGLSYATGDYVSIMDVDLQDPPMLLCDMIEGIQKEGYDCVATRRVTRDGEAKLRSFFAKLFYKMINKISKTEIIDGARDFRVMTRKMVDSILKLGEYNRFSKGIFSWVGFETKWLEYENVQRVGGSTKWSFWKLFIYAVDGIVAFSTVPLELSSMLGLVCCLIAVIGICVVIVKTLAFGDPVAGYPSLVCIIMFLGGVQLLSIGILGKYLEKTYLETKRRPAFIIKEDNIISSVGKKE